MSEYVPNRRHPAEDTGCPQDGLPSCEKKEFYLNVTTKPDPYIKSKNVRLAYGCFFKEAICAHDITLVMFYESGMQEANYMAKKLAKEFGKAADSTKRDSAAFMTFDCDTNERLCYMQENITGIPFLKLYSKGSQIGSYASVHGIDHKQMKKIVEKAPIIYRPAVGNN